MNTAIATFRFLGFGRAQRATPVDDPADMGTCFGLDLSLDDVPSPTPGPADPPVSTGWWRRLAGRRVASS
jgi:hypothetical protein